MRLIDADEATKRAVPLDLFGRLIMVVPESELKRMPTVPQWIPVTERLPKKEGHFFVTDAAAGMAETLIDKYLRCDDGEWVWLYSQNVVAWMPLPEPYQGDGK